MRLYFKKLTTVCTESLRCTDSDVGIFNKICQDYGFVSGLQTLSFGWCSAGLFDHIFIFKTKEGQKYAVVNPYLKPEEIAIILDGMGLADQSTILGPGFWNAGTTAVLLPFEPVMDIVKYRYFKSMGLSLIHI